MEIGADAVPAIVATAVTMIGAGAEVVDVEVVVEEQEVDDNSMSRLSMVLLFNFLLLYSVGVGVKRLISKGSKLRQGSFSQCQGISLL